VRRKSRKSKVYRLEEAPLFLKAPEFPNNKILDIPRSEKFLILVHGRFDAGQDATDGHEICHTCIIALAYTLRVASSGKS